MKNLNIKHRKHSAQKRFGLYMLTAFFIAGILLTACDMWGFYDDGIHYITGTEYDLYGYNKDGYNAAGYDIDGYNADGYDAEGYNKDGYNANGYNRNGYKADGYNDAGFDADGEHRNGTKYNDGGYGEDGYNAEGFNAEGKHRDTGKQYDLYGYDKDGYNAAGFNADGNHRNGTKYGTDGYDEQGYDINGFNAEGYDIGKFKRDGYNDEGDHRDDFLTLSAAGNTTPGGIWSDGTTMWVSDTDNGKIYAYNMNTHERDANKDFDTLSAAGNTAPRGIWADEETMWVLDTNYKVYTYNMSTKVKESVTGEYPSVLLATDIWSDGTTMWLSSETVGIHIFAFEIGTLNTVASKDIEFSANNSTARNIWSDGTTMWAADGRRDVIEAYPMSPPLTSQELSDGERDTTKDFATIAVVAGEDIELRGIWSNGTTMWIVDNITNKIYAYDLATGARPPKAAE